MPTHATLGLDGKVPSDQLPAGGPGGFSGAYADLTGKPTLGTAAAQDTTAFDAAGAAAAAQAAAIAASQPLDSDLTAIAALTTTSYGRSFLAMADAAAAKTALSLAKDDVGLGSVDNTADAAKTVAAAATASACSGNALTATTLQNARNINGTSFNGSANIDAVPTWKCGQTTRDISTASGTQNIAHGLGRVPSFVRIRAQMVFSAAVSMENNASFCGSAQSGQCIIWTEGTSTATTDNIYQSTAAALGLSNAGGVNPFTGATKASGVISVDATNIIITWTKSGSPTGTANIQWECT